MNDSKEGRNKGENSSDWLGRQSKIAEQFQDKPDILATHYLGEVVGYIREVRNFSREMEANVGLLRNETDKSLQEQRRWMEGRFRENEKISQDSVGQIQQHIRHQNQEMVKFIRDMEKQCEKRTKNLPKGPFPIWMLERLVEIVSNKPTATVLVISLAFLCLVLLMATTVALIYMGVDVSEIIKLTLHKLLGG